MSTATAGNTTASVAFTAPGNDGGTAITGYAVNVYIGGALQAGLKKTGAASPIMVTGLTNGTAYTFKVIATNSVGNSVESNASSAVTPVAPTNSGGGNGGTKTPATPTQGTVVVIVNGASQNSGTETKSTEQGKSVVTVQVNNKAIEDKINEAIKTNPTGAGNTLQVPVTDNKSDVAKVMLTGDIIKKLETNTYDLSIKRDTVEYLIPAREFTISSVASSLGVAEVSLKDINIEVKITKLDASVVAKYEQVAKANGAEMVFPPTEFEIIAKTTRADGTTKDVSISKFSNYVERIMEIPAGVNPNKITTGIVFNPDGTYSHVPTEVFQKDGKWFAKLNSLTNSNYSVIWNPITGEWAKAYVKDVLSAHVFNGTTTTTISPKSNLTYGEAAQAIKNLLVESKLINK